MEFFFSAILGTHFSVFGKCHVLLGDSNHGLPPTTALGRRKNKVVRTLKTKKRNAFGVVHFFVLNNKMKLKMIRLLPFLVGDVRRKRRSSIQPSRRRFNSCRKFKDWLAGGVDFLDSLLLASVDK